VISNLRQGGEPGNGSAIHANPIMRCPAKEVVCRHINHADVYALL
jgi:hypothetical protein